MRCINKVIIVIVAIGITSPSFAARCPIGQLVYVDKNSGREFIPERVSIYSGPLCTHEVPEKGERVRCIEAELRTIEGRWEGAKVYAQRESFFGWSPCCGWYSYNVEDPEGPRPEVWLDEKAANVDRYLPNQFDGLQDWGVFRPDSGPLAGGVFKAVCPATS